MRLVPALLLLVASPLLAQDPVDARGWLSRGVAEFKSANYPAAVADFQRAVQSDPSLFTARLYLATAWAQQFIPGAQNPENLAVAAAAEREFRTALAMDPGNKIAISYLASLALNQKKWDDAQAWYEKLVAAEPGDATAWYGMGFIAWSRFYPAVVGARTSLGMKLDDPGPLTSQPVRSELRAKYGPVIDQGLQAFQQALLIDPKYYDAMAYMNLLTRERADLRATVEEYRQDVAAADEWVRKALETKREKAQAARAGTPEISGTTPAESEKPLERIQVGGKVMAASIVRKVQPIYPIEASAKGIHGTVQLSVLISQDGSVLEAKLLSGDPILGESAVEAVRQWIYKPTILNGKPVAVATLVDVAFQLQ